MPKNIWIAGALALLVGGAGFAVWNANQDPEGEAVGVSSRGLDVWERLSEYEAHYLRSWSSALHAPPERPLDVLEAFNELAYSVTGPGGFWRKTLPGWLGCASDAETAPCVALTDAASEFEKWDALQGKIQKLSERKARRFLVKHHEELIEYLDTYVPAEPNDTAMRQTKFYETHLAASMASL